MISSALTSKKTKMLVGAISLGAMMITFTPQPAWGIGEASTRFQLFVPPNNDNVGRDVALIVTAVHAGTSRVQILDDDADGDDDDTHRDVLLKRGESFVVYLRDGAVNDDAGGKQDGDYMIVEADHPVIVQMATRSNWQHDWAPSDGKSSRGESFFVWAPPSSGSDNDVNVYAYADDTVVTVEDVTQTPTTAAGKTQVDLSQPRILLRTTLSAGDDLNVTKGLGIDILVPGHTYWIRATKAVTVQYGHLGSTAGLNQARDGGGFVPSENGTSTGELFYFAIPHNPGRASEKELRLVSYDAAAQVTLYGRQGSGPWVQLLQQTLGQHEHLDLVGASSTAFRQAELYKLEVTSGKRVTVFAANWLETGSPGTSDFASAVSSANGSGSGRTFIAYLGPPGLQHRVSGIAGSGGYYAHLYVFARDDDTQVHVTDLDTGGTLVDRNFTLAKGRYHDVVVDLATYQALNQPLSGRRPYLRVESDKPIAVLNTNFNDNWMAYATSPLGPDPQLDVSTNARRLGCGERATVTLELRNDGAPLSQTAATVALPAGLSFISAARGGALINPAVTSVGGAEQLAIALPQGLATSSAETLTVTVERGCASAGSCTASGLFTLSAGVAGSHGGARYASQASLGLELGQSSAPVFETLAASYDGSAAELTLELSALSASTVASLRLSRATDPDAPPAALAELSVAGQTSSSFRDIAVTPGGSYYYRVEAVSGAGCSLGTFGPLVVQVPAAGSSAQSGGLESNGRLARALAQRAVRRALHAELRERRPELAVKRAALSSSRLVALLPPEGPAGSSPQSATPNDLPQLTNAATVMGVDYVDPRGQRVATALLIETSGELYEHSKALCERAGGARLERVSRALAGEHPLMRLEVLQRRDERREHAVTFKLYDSVGGDEVKATSLRSAWPGCYPKPSAGQRVINVQVWSSRPGYELALAESLIARASAERALESSAGSAPARWIAAGSTLGGVAQLSLGGDHESPSKLRWRWRREGSAVFLAEDQRIETLAAKTTVLRRQLPLHEELEVQLLGADDVVSDAVWLSDGTWARYDDGLWGGATETSAFSSSCADAPPRPTSPSAAEQLTLAGCAGVEGVAATFGGLARHLGGGRAPLDLRPYASVGLWLRSSRAAALCLHRRGAAKPACRELGAQPDGRRLNLDLAAFQPRAEALSDVFLITVASHGAGPYRLEVSGLRFSSSPARISRDMEGSSGCSAIGPRHLSAVPMGLSTLVLLLLLAWRRRAMSR